MRSDDLSARTIRPTRVELVVLEYLVQDLTNTQIGKRMFLEVSTIKTHISRLMRLSRVKSRTGLAITFVRWRDLGVSNPYWDEPDIVYSQVGGRGSEHP